MGPGSCFVCWKFCKSPSVSNYKKSRFTTARVNHLSTEKGRTLCRSGNICRSFWCAFARFCCELKYLTHIMAAGVTLCNRDSDTPNCEMIWMCVWMDVWKDMKYCEKIWNEFFSGKSSWNAVFPFSEYKEHCEMECEMHLWNEIIKNECVDFSWRFISFHKHDFVKRYELVCEKIWNESWKAEFNSFSSQIEVYSNVCFRFLVLWPLGTWS